MRLHVLSDLHLEFGDFHVPDVSPDAVVIAGDLHVGTRGLPWLAERMPGVPILYVLGNHEYYKQSMPGLVNKLRAGASEVEADVRILDQDAISLDGVWFLGATLWTDFALHGDPTIGMLVAADAMTDYRKIRVEPNYRRLRPADLAAAHQRQRRWLEQQLAELSGQPVVVVTHHAPTPASVAPELQGDTLSAAYASAMDELVGCGGASLWVHGHTHVAVDRQMGDTRLLSNPRGYAGHGMVDGFRPDLVVEV